MPQNTPLAAKAKTHLEPFAPPISRGAEKSANGAEKSAKGAEKSATGAQNAATGAQNAAARVVDAFERTDRAASLPPVERWAEAQLSAVRLVTDAAITSARGTIDDLRWKISDLEAENRRLADQVRNHNVTRQSLQASVQRLEQSRRKKRQIGMIAAMMGVPQVTVMSAVMIDEDNRRIRELGDQIRNLQDKQRVLNAKRASYAATRDKVQTKLRALEAEEEKLSGVSSTRMQLPGATLAPVSDAANELLRRQSLLANLRSQIELLKELHHLARGLNTDLKSFLDEMEKMEALAEKMVAESEKRLMELVKVVTSPEPNAAASQWLEKHVAKETKKLIGQLSLEVQPFVKHLVKGEHPRGGPDAQKLQASLLKVLAAN